MKSLTATLVVLTLFCATVAKFAANSEVDQVSLDPSSHQGTQLCTNTGKPGFPRPRQGQHNYVITNCVEGPIQAAIAEMNKNLRGTIFLQCSRPVTIVLRRSLRLARLGNYRIFGTGRRVTLSGGGRRPILWVGGGGRIEIQRVTFQQGRVADNVGGAAILSSWTTNMVIADCIFRRNRAFSSRAFGGGAAIRGLGGDVRIWNCIFADNRASTGGAVHVTSGNLRIFNSKFFDNFATGGRDDRGIVAGAGGGLRVDRALKSRPLPILICGCLFQRNDIQRPRNRNGDDGSAVEVYNDITHLPASMETVAVIKTTFLENGRRGGAGNVLMIHGAGKSRLTDVRLSRNRVIRQTLRIGSPSRWLTSLTRVSFERNGDGGRFLTINRARCSMNNVRKDGVRVSCNSL